jgi:DNA repair protein RadC
VDKSSSHTSINSWADSEKPREKSLLNGIASLTDAELIAILLNTGTKNKSAVDLARELLANVNHDIDALGKMNIAELKKINGVGTAKAVTISAALELGRRRQLSNPEKIKLTSSSEIYRLIGPLLADLTYEEFWVILLSRSNRLIAKKKLATGGIAGVYADQKMVIQYALEQNATSLAVVHNHPSGNLMPSENDNKLTYKIKEACKYFDISFLDHLIIGHKDYFSYADQGLI